MWNLLGSTTRVFFGIKSYAILLSLRKLIEYISDTSNYSTMFINYVIFPLQCLDLTALTKKYISTPSPRTNNTLYVLKNINKNLIKRFSTNANKRAIE